MSDEEFLTALESCTLPQAQFGHAGHVRAAYVCLCRAEFAEALQRIRNAIRRYAASLGKPDRYHETITVAFAALIRQRLCELGPGSGWEEFERNNPDLMRADRLQRLYSRRQLDSDLARRTFLLPDGGGPILDP